MPLADSFPHFFIPVGFAGGLVDRDTGLVRFGWRDYDPEVGRFTAPDPARDMRGDGDVYDYCVDDPVSRIDLLGLRFTRAAAVAGGESHKGISHPFGAPHGESMGYDVTLVAAARKPAARGAGGKAGGGKNATMPATRNGTMSATGNGTAPATQNATEKKTQPVRPTPRQDDSVPLGVELNNPLNVRALGSKDPWQGQTDVFYKTTNPKEQGFSKFDTLDNGLRAGAINIISQQALHGKNTVLEIVKRLTPDNENATADYARKLARAMGVGVNDKIDTMDKDTLTKFMNAAIFLEVGQSYPPKQIEKAVNTAIAHHEEKKKK